MDGPDYLLVTDLDGDGLVEVAEVVNEYPREVMLSAEEEGAIEKDLGEQGVSEFDEEARRIAMREKGGRGRQVAWGIYSYDGVYLEPQLGENYEKYFFILKEENEDLMRETDLSEDSVEYIESTRKFWTRR